MRWLSSLPKKTPWQHTNLWKFKIIFLYSWETINLDEMFIIMFRFRFCWPIWRDKISSSFHQRFGDSALSPSSSDNPRIIANHHLFCRWYLLYAPRSKYIMNCRRLPQDRSVWSFRTILGKIFSQNPKWKRKWVYICMSQNLNPINPQQICPCWIILAGSSCVFLLAPLFWDRKKPSKSSASAEWLSRFS